MATTATGIGATSATTANIPGRNTTTASSNNTASLSPRIFNLSLICYGMRMRSYYSSGAITLLSGNNRSFSIRSNGLFHFTGFHRLRWFPYRVIFRSRLFVIRRVGKRRCDNDRCDKESFHLFANHGDLLWVGEKPNE